MLAPRSPRQAELPLGDLRGGGSDPADYRGYSTRDAAGLLGLTPARVRSLVRVGVLTPRRGPRSHYRFEFQDLVLLRAASALLAAGVPMGRVQRGLHRLPEQLAPGRSLSSVRITAEGRDVVVQEGQRRWQPESGQWLLDFGPPPSPGAPVRRLARVPEPDGLEGEPELTADQWFDVACELELIAPADARAVYERAVEIDPGHADAHLNLGRLLHEMGELAAAEGCYERALELRPDDSIGYFNLGVVLEDLERPERARLAYEGAVALDPGHADAFFNLAGVCEKLGAFRDAVRYLKRCRELSRST